MHAILLQTDTGLDWVENCPDEEVNERVSEISREAPDNAEAVLAVRLSAFRQLDNPAGDFDYEGDVEVQVVPAGKPASGVQGL